MRTSGSNSVGVHRSKFKMGPNNQQDLNKMIDLVNFGGKKIVYMLKMGGFEMGPNKIWIKNGTQ